MWDKSIIELLITKYKEHENLYNARNPLYTDRLKRSKSLEDICKQLKEIQNSITVDDIRKKIHTLRAQYIKESHAIESHRRNAASEEDVYKPRLWYFDKLLFLKPHICRKKYESKESTINEYNEDDVSSDIQSKHTALHHRSNTRYNEYDESSIKVEISIEEDGENQTQHPYKKIFNEGDGTTIANNSTTNTNSEPPIQQPCNDGFNKCNETYIDNNDSTEEKREPVTLMNSPNRHRCKKRKGTSELDEQLNNVKRLLVKQLEKNNDYDWLGKQVVFEMKSIRNRKIQRDTAWKIQTILREASIEDEAITECESEQLSMDHHSGTQSTCGSCCSNNNLKTCSSLSSVIRNSDSMDRCFKSCHNPVRPLHPVCLIPAKSSDSSTSYLYSPDNL